MGQVFDRFARRASTIAGSPWVFLLAVTIVVAWAVSGPFVRFSEVWQLAINTGTTIVTFLVVFLIQHTQNADTAEIKALLKEIAEDLPEVHHERIPERIEEET